MTNFSITFSNPWLLLLLVPAALLTLIPYFRLNKRYRCTRNRIVSMALHVVIMVLAVALLAGLGIDYDLPNDKNEVILLVDASFSEEALTEEKNQFIKDVVDSNNSAFKLGIVTFGYDQVYAAELTKDMSTVYASYLQAPLPDVTATDVESALNYAATLFEYPETARIVLISDVLETDGSLAKTIKSVAAKGIKVDTVYMSDDSRDDEVQLIGMERPEERIEVGSPFSVKLSLQSNYQGTATVTPYDNDVAGIPFELELKEGIQDIYVPFEFTLPGLHRMSFEIMAGGDTLAENNVFHSYIYLEIFDDILVIESNHNESEALCRMLKDELNATVMNIGSVGGTLTTVDDLRRYDEIVLVNVSNGDMPEGFVALLHTYVHDFGGGLFTICGNTPDSDPNDEEWTANAYTREDMYGTLYQDMLPVEAINYTPPTAVMIIIDRSGSMTTDTDGKLLPESENKLLFAKNGATECLELLSERDYVGIMSFADSFTEHIELTPRTQRDKILAAIEHINGEDGGGTNFSPALERAGKALAAMTDVENKHIIFISDGEPSAGDADRYKYWLQENAKNGITTSFIGVRCTNSAKNTMKILLTQYAGMSEENFHDVVDLNSASSTIKKDFEVNKIMDVNYETFTPKINDVNSPIVEGVLQENMPTLDGFYGLKVKEDADVILSGRFTPIYAQWSYGLGRVGTFACDLNGTWSSSFIDTPEGNDIVNNIVASLFPLEDLKPKEIEVEHEGGNYFTKLNIFTDLIDDQYIEVTVTSPATAGGESEVQTLTAGAGDNYSRLSFTVKTSGIHEIVTRKRAADGTLLAETVIYKALSYSQEYNVFTDKDAAKALSEQLATDGRGIIIEEPYQVYENAAKLRHVDIDPRIPMMIALLILFLLDIAVRKFKWKWPHELIRDRKAKKAMARHK
ncbi:MAG: VWA domain-containing protein [Clostridia bacterium]|nr:VWA domain-containing protein [Clostridia bacterium]